jgi:hypothetical protein
VVVNTEAGALRDANAVVGYLLALGGAKVAGGMDVDEWVAWDAANLAAPLTLLAAATPAAVAEAAAAAAFATSAALEVTVRAGRAIVRDPIVHAPSPPPPPHPRMMPSAARGNDGGGRHAAGGSGVAGAWCAAPSGGGRGRPQARRRHQSGRQGGRGPQRG